MPTRLDPLLLLLFAALLFPLARVLVFVVAAAVSLWSRKRSRRLEARRLLGLLYRPADEAE